MSDVTHILSQIEHGDAAAERLLPLVYDELRNSLPPNWRAKSRARRFRLRRWYTKLTCVWLAVSRPLLVTRRANRHL